MSSPSEDHTPKVKLSAAARRGVDVDATVQLPEIRTLLIQDADRDVLYARIVDAAAALMSSGFASLQAYSPERQELRLLAHKGFRPESAAFWEVVRLGSGTACGIAASSGARSLIPDVEAPESNVGRGNLDAYRKSGIRAVQSTPLLSQSGQLLGMLSTHWGSPCRPLDDAFRPLDVLARQAADLIERARIHAALRESEARSRLLASIVESSNDAIVTKNLDSIITSWNKGAERIFGYSAEEVIGRPITLLTPSERHDEEPAILARVRRGERIEHYETVRRRKDGRLINISLTVSPIVNLENEIVGASNIARDITERTHEEKMAATLAREAEHRAKNVLSIVLATVHLSSSDTPDELKRVIERRIRALADVHALFAESRWAGADVRTVVAKELKPYCRDQDGRARIEGPSINVGPASAQAIAVTLHELATNAAKYGALSTEEGRISVEWSLMDENRLRLCWVEIDGPAVMPSTHQGFGMRVMQNIIAAQGGKFAIAWRPQGLACEIIVPV